MNITSDSSGFKPSLSAGSKSEGLPAGQEIPGLEPSQASHFRLPIAGVKEKITLIWRDAEESLDCWVLLEKGDQSQLESLKMELGETMGQAGRLVERALDLETSEGHRISLVSKFTVAAGRPYVYFQFLDARRGTGSLGGRRIDVGLIRSPSSGAFSIGSGSRILLDLDQDGEFANTTFLDEDGKLRFGETFPLSQPFLVDGQPYRVSKVSTDGTRLEIETATLQPTLARGFEMPELEIEMLDGSRLSLSQLRGKTIVLNWWFTACSPCLSEMPGLNQMAQRFAGRGDVEFVAIANNDRETLQAFLKDTPFAFRQALADEQVINLLGRGFPRHLIIDQTGRVALNRIGGSKNIHELLEAVLEQVLPGR
ncbi:MAG TPA: TlpA disulfide reductase family protein [Acidobacteriota bacterium]|nr:TlpA disulfide reductase family protein [Acidobacteriota bacterium]